MPHDPLCCPIFLCVFLGAQWPGAQLAGTMDVHFEFYFAKTFSHTLCFNTQGKDRQVLGSVLSPHRIQLDCLLFLYHTVARSPDTEGTATQVLVVLVPARDLTP